MATVFAVKAAAGKASSSHKGRDGGRKPSGFSASLLSENPLVIKVEIPAEPVKGKANRMLLFGLEKMLGCPVRIVSGHTSRRKTLAANCTAEEFVRKIKSNEQR